MLWYVSFQSFVFVFFKKLDHMIFINYFNLSIVYVFQKAYKFLFCFPWGYTHLAIHFQVWCFFFFLLILYMSNPTEVVVLFSSLFSLIISHTPTSWLQVSLQTTLRISTLAPLIHLLAEQASQLVKKQVLRLLKVVSILMSHQHLSSCSPTKELTS